MSSKLSRLEWPSSANASSTEPARARILLVDDVPANLVALRAILEPLEQELVLAHSGDEALLELLQRDFACILMDVQ
ncbi:MAG: response regulator, partial [Archangium sp.]